ncbi:hypothetical protein [Propionivibrio sp.]|uniref:hypothetical protein n=1 Tax=Propionivibrio sp. TaxID=2212460 RepID=UPI003BEF7DDF
MLREFPTSPPTPLMKLIANRPSCQKTAAKSLVIPEGEGRFECRRRYFHVNLDKADQRRIADRTDEAFPDINTLDPNAIGRINFQARLHRR